MCERSLKRSTPLTFFHFSLSVSDLAPAFINNVYNIYQLKEYQPFKVNRGKLRNQLVFLKETGSLVSDIVLIKTNMTEVSVVEIKGKIDVGKNCYAKEGA